MGSPAKTFTAFAASFFVLVMWKDGTLGKLFNDANRGAQDVITGLKPITRIG